MTTVLGHSPLGASGASRWMKCPGSVGLSSGIEDEESDFAALGTAAHALAAQCLKLDDDAWEYMGWSISPDGDITNEPHEGPAWIVVDKDMVDAVQVYLDYVRTKFPDRNQGNTFIERRFYCLSIHKLFYGTADFAHLMTLMDGPDVEPCKLYVTDYKHGAGIVVEAEENPQLKYYACGILEDLGLWDSVEEVVLTIVQPRGWHFDGPIRSWTTTTDELRKWLHEQLVPAMDNALVSTEVKSGEHCRFCPARAHACPQLMSDTEELEAMAAMIEGAKGAEALTNEQVARLLKLKETVKIAVAAAEKTGYNRLNAGAVIPGFKLGKKRSNRIFRDGVEAEAVAVFGEDAYAPKKLRSPAQIDELPMGEKFTAQHAYKPDAGLTVVPESDARPAVSRDTKSLFKPVKKGK